MFDGKHILIIVENLPVPFDRRVWQEANTLKDNGAKVSIICPKMKQFNKAYEIINGIEIYRHPLPVEGEGALSYLFEYLIALFWEWALSMKIFIKKRFHVIQGCNPPDLVFLVALFYKFFRVKYVFDHHDINPELFIAKYGKKGFYYNLMLLTERLTFATASFSIATNESYKEIAIKRGKMRADKVQVVRSGPKLARLKPGEGNVKYKKGRQFLVGYVGVIGAQEGLDLLLESAKLITQIRNDVQFAIVGDGTELEKIRVYAQEMKLENYVDFYGRVDDDTLVEILNTSDVCVNPDKPTVMNNLSTMNKIMEYMALKKPIVQYNLKEGKLSAQDASLYAENTSTDDFANKIMWLLDHPEERDRMGEYGHRRIINELSWEHESKNLLHVYQKVFDITIKPSLTIQEIEPSL
jgi:glycosyltransferase involved in cell wall biosynthesis